ncbi:LysE family translocator [Rhizobium sp. SSA_523]|uniref:LysE family translocator n=1 Tax=Rhizobium sp. SSA_523 TaxID=2952477 RepID=UPI0020913BF8|nr:LysE family translocator [Rhizobium sp. SSA_523]MCO5730325.1 LysE family translocator [Rhizobium sp. SSA_523]WKC25374.1 LysE family translocator [Rhizobium sp. SSA_523]
MLHAYLIALTGIALAQISPGPNLFAVAGAGLGHGRKAAFFVVLGIASAILVWVAAAAAGLGALLTLYPSVLTVMKVLGGSYLCFIGIRALRSAIRGGPPSIKANEGAWTPCSAWRHGLLINLSNPKSALAWAALATFLYGSGLTGPQVLGFAPLGFLSAIVIYGVYAILFSTGLVRKLQARFTRATDALFGLAFGAIGARILADGVGEVVRR